MGESGRIPSTWLWFPTAQGEPTPDYNLEATLQRCGDGIVTDGLEECDDGNQNDADACTNSCHSITCGDGIVEGAEQCDDGNTIGDDGCEKCKIKTSSGMAFYAAIGPSWNPGTPTKLYKYTADSNAWAAAGNMPAGSHAHPTNDGVHLYSLGLDNVIRAYDTTANNPQWAVTMIPNPPVGVEAAGGGSLADSLVWFADGFYYLDAHVVNTTPGSYSSDHALYVYRNAHPELGWTLVDDMTNAYATSEIGWDQNGDELYVRMWTYDQSRSFRVYNTLTDTVARTVTLANTTSNIYERQGSLAGGYVYASAYGPYTVKAAYLKGGEPSIDTGKNNGITTGGWDTDHANGMIYSLGWALDDGIHGGHTSFRRFSTAPYGYTEMPLPTHYSLGTISFTFMRPQ